MTISRNIQALLFLGLMACVLQSCYKDNREDLYKNYNPTDCNLEVTYSEVISSIMTTRCAVSGCHNSTTNERMLDLSTYADASKIALNGQMMGRITAQNGPLMPPGAPLPDCEILQIQAWIDDGAPNN